MNNQAYVSPRNGPRRRLFTRTQSSGYKNANRDYHLTNNLNSRQNTYMTSGSSHAETQIKSNSKSRNHGRFRSISSKSLFSGAKLKNYSQARLQNVNLNVNTNTFTKTKDNFIAPASRQSTIDHQNHQNRVRTSLQQALRQKLDNKKQLRIEEKQKNYSFIRKIVNQSNKLLGVDQTSTISIQQRRQNLSKAYDEKKFNLLVSQYAQTEDNVHVSFDSMSNFSSPSNYNKSNFNSGNNNNFNKPNHNSISSNANHTNNVNNANNLSNKKESGRKMVKTSVFSIQIAVPERMTSDKLKNNNSRAKEQYSFGDNDISANKDLQIYKHRQRSISKEKQQQRHRQKQIEKQKEKEKYRQKKKQEQKQKQKQKQKQRQRSRERERERERQRSRQKQKQKQREKQKQKQRQKQREREKQREKQRMNERKKQVEKELKKGKKQNSYQVIEQVQQLKPSQQIKWNTQPITPNNAKTPSHKSSKQSQKQVKQVQQQPKPIPTMMKKQLKKQPKKPKQLPQNQSISNKYSAEEIIQIDDLQSVTLTTQSKYAEPQKKGKKNKKNQQAQKIKPVQPVPVQKTVQKKQPPLAPPPRLDLKQKQIQQLSQTNKFIDIMTPVGEVAGYCAQLMKKSKLSWHTSAILLYKQCYQKFKSFQPVYIRSAQMGIIQNEQKDKYIEDNATILKNLQKIITMGKKKSKLSQQNQKLATSTQPLVLDSIIQKQVIKFANEYLQSQQKQNKDTMTCLLRMINGVKIIGFLKGKDVQPLKSVDQIPQDKLYVAVMNNLQQISLKKLKF